MELNEYQAGALTTAIYPGQGTALGLAYCALKLNGEAGEFAEHLGKALRDDDLFPLIVTEDPTEGVGTVVNANLLPGNGLEDARRALLIKELGDVLWYIAAAAKELDIDLNQIAEINLSKLAKRAEENKLGGSGDER